VRTCALLALAALAFAAIAQDVPPGTATPQEIFERALRERARGDLNEAIRSFSAILDANPGLNRARLELAVAYYQAMDHRAVRANVERLIAQIEAEAEPHRFGGTASVGLLYDSNVSAGPSAPGLSLDPSAVPRSDSALTVTIGGSHRYLSKMRPGIGGRDGALLWQSQATISQIAYRHESDFDLQMVSLTTGPAWISPPRLRALAPLQFDRLNLGGDHYLDILGINPAVVFGRIEELEVQLDAQLQKRDYRRQIDVGRDSRYRAFGLQANRAIRSMTVQAGGRLNSDNADDNSWDYRGTEWFGLVAGPLARRTTGYLRYSYLRSAYDLPDPVTGTSRTDRETRWALGASHRFGGADDPWSANLTLLDIDHKSDVPFYAFDRRQWSLTLMRTF
jgi:hypothetical protein